MNGFLWKVAFLLTAVLAGCGSAKLFGANPVPETPGAAELPWPRLIDTPEAPPKGAYTAAVPDPAQGTALTVQLGLAARDAAVRAEALSEPVLTEADRRRLTRER